MNGSNHSLLNSDDTEPDGCGVRAFAVVRVPQAEFPALRKRPGPDVGKVLSPGVLRQSDEQAVAAVAAVFQAIHDFNLQETDFTDWGVVGAPNLLGRAAAAAVLDKFGRTGPRSVSPLVSAYLSLHAVSAMISVALKSHGPNLGVGGGPGAVGDGLLTGLTLLSEQSAPGVWLALSAWDPEPEAPSAVCHAAALALVPAGDHWTGLRLRYLASNTGAAAKSPTVASLAAFLGAYSEGDRWRCPMNDADQMELTDEASPAWCAGVEL